MTVRNLGFVFCLVGALVMIAGRFAPGAPAWLVYVGLSGIVFGWGLFALSIIQRMSAVRAAASPNPKS